MLLYFYPKLLKSSINDLYWKPKQLGKYHFGVIIQKVSQYVIVYLGYINNFWTPLDIVWQTSEFERWVN